MLFHSDIRYAATLPETRIMDVWLPDQGGNGAAILFIHGGGWQGGDKKQFHPVAEWFCERGYVCASMKYRLSQQAKYPAAVEDARLAMQFLRSKAGEWGFDARRIAAIGSSAGGYLAAMLGLITPGDGLGRTDELREEDTRPGAAALYCPVTTLHAERGFILEFIGCRETDAPDLYAEASPIDRIRGGEPPVLIVQGDVDTTTPLEDAEQFIAKLQRADTRAELHTLPGVEHGFGYGTHTEAQRAACRLIEQFLKSVWLMEG
jgi:acetyl esterase/lipase